MKASPFGIRSGCFDSGQMCWTVYSSFRPIQYDSQSPIAAPSDAAIQIGQKLIPPAMTIVPMPIKAAQAGSSSEIKASDSPNASRKTTRAPIPRAP